MLIYEERPNDDIDVRIRKDTDFPPHFHHCLEIIYIIEGTQQFYAESKIYNIGSGDLLVIFPYQIHEFIKSENKSVLIIAGTNMLEDFNIEFKEYIPQYPFIKNEALPSDFRRVIDFLLAKKDDNSAYGRPILKGVLTIIIGEVLGSLKLVKRGHDGFTCGYGELMQNTVNYCMNNYQSPDISLQKTAIDLNVSPSYLSHFLADKFHISFPVYINSLRVEYACGLLRNSADTVIEIAYKSGYNNVRTFNRAFLKLKGISPLKYRENNKRK